MEVKGSHSAEPERGLYILYQAVGVQRKESGYMCMKEGLLIFLVARIHF